MSPDSRADADWLALRVEADDAARARTVDSLLPPLVNYLDAAGADECGVEVIDLGSGTGANQRWLSPRLPFEQRWLLVDHDHAWQRRRPAAARTRLLTADVGILPSILNRKGSAQLVTCSALLDVLTRGQIEALGSALTEARRPALFSLTVTGDLELSPPHPLDADLLGAFNDHQRRGGRAGPEAVHILDRILRSTDCTFSTVETPWLLDRSSDDEFVRRFLTERVAVAVAQDPSLASVAADWLGLRLAQLADRALELSVGHRDLLILPHCRDADA